MMEHGRIIKIVSNRYVVLCKEEQIVCVAMGKLRKDKAPVVGDDVMFERFDDQNGIQKILPRRNELVRPAIANVDQAIIVMSAKDPDFSTVLIDRLIFQIVYANIHPVLCVTKMDLIDEKDSIHTAIEQYRKSGYDVYTSGTAQTSEAIEELLANKISVLTGQSGAGKSSLLNRIDPSFHLQTQEISKALGRGKHTTRHCQLHQVKSGWVADTPGFSSLDFSHMNINQLQALIPDFKAYSGKCRFRDCVHLKEPGCAIREAVEQGFIHGERYQHYEDVVQLIRQYKSKY